MLLGVNENLVALQVTMKTFETKDIGRTRKFLQQELKQAFQGAGSAQESLSALKLTCPFS